MEALIEPLGEDRVVSESLCDSDSVKQIQIKLMQTCLTSMPCGSWRNIDLIQARHKKVNREPCLMRRNVPI